MVADLATVLPKGDKDFEIMHFLSCLSFVVVVGTTSAGEMVNFDFAWYCARARVCVCVFTLP